MFLIIFNSIFFVLINGFNHSENSNSKSHKYCIVGAGPAGIQMAYFLQSYSLDYIVLEKSERIGNSYYNQPDFATLSNFNKRFTGSKNSEFNLRFDWNSLLNNDSNFRFPKMYKEFYPKSKDYFDYLKRFANKYNLKIQFNTELFRINDNLKLQTSMGIYQCEVVILAVGLSYSITNHNINLENCYSIRDNLERFKNLQIKMYNDEHFNFQLGYYLQKYVGAITFFISGFIDLAFNNGLTRGIRSNYLHLIDSYQLKSLDGLDSINLNIIDAFPSKFKGIICDQNTFNVTLISHLVVFNRFNRYYIFPNYKIIANMNIYIIGAAAESISNDKDTSEEIVGIRYLLRTLFKIFLFKFENTRWDSKFYKISNLIDILMLRINEASGLFRTPYLLGDYVLISEDLKSFQYVEEYFVNNQIEIQEETGLKVNDLFFVLRFESGILDKKIYETYEYRFKSKRFSRSHENQVNNQFLHPVIYAFKIENMVVEFRETVGVYHMKDDIYMKWTDIRIIYSDLYQFINNYLSLSSKIPYFDKETGLLDLMAVTF